MADPLAADGKNLDEVSAIPKDKTDAVMRKNMRSYYFLRMGNYLKDYRLRVSIENTLTILFEIVFNF